MGILCAAAKLVRVRRTHRRQVRGVVGRERKTDSLTAWHRRLTDGRDMPAPEGKTFRELYAAKLALKKGSS